MSRIELTTIRLATVRLPTIGALCAAHENCTGRRSEKPGLLLEDSSRLLLESGGRQLLERHRGMEYAPQPGTPPPALLLETGGYLRLENGMKMNLEQSN